MGWQSHYHALVPSLLAVILLSTFQVRCLTTQDEEHPRDSIARLLPAAAGHCIDKICSHMEEPEQSGCVTELVHLCDPSMNTDQDRNDDPAAYVMKNANGRRILRYDCPPSQPCDVDLTDRVASVSTICLDIISICNGDKAEKPRAGFAVASQLSQALQKLYNKHEATDGLPLDMDDQGNTALSEDEEPCGEGCGDIDSLETDHEDSMNTDDISGSFGEPNILETENDSDTRTGTQKDISKKWSERLTPFSKRWSARISPFNKKWSERLSPFSKKYGKKWGGKAILTIKKWNSKQAPFAKKWNEDMSPTVDKKWSARLTPFTKKQSESMEELPQQWSQSLPPSLDKKWGQRVSPSFNKRWSQRLTPFSKKWSERVPPNFSKKWSERLTPFSKKWSERLPPNFSKKWSERLTPFSKKWSERLPPSFTKKWSERLTPFSKRSIQLLGDERDENMAVVPEKSSRSVRVKRWSERLLPHMMSHSRRAIAMRAIVDKKNKIKRVLLRRSLHPRLTSQPDWEMLRRYPWTI